MNRAVAAVPPVPVAAATGRPVRLQRRCAACGAKAKPEQDECDGCKAARVQRRLAVGASDDPFEHDADAAAARVIGMQAPQRGSGAPLVLRRLDHTTRSEDDEPAPASVDEVLRSPGQPLDRASRAFFEPRFGRDFAQVRVHHDAAAARSANAVQARAYTVGAHLVFATGQHAPDSSAGRALLAHELAHVVQQASAPPLLQRQGGTASAPAPPPPPPPRRPTDDEREQIEAARRAAAVRAQLALTRVGGQVPEGRNQPGQRMREQAWVLARRLFEPWRPNMEQVELMLRGIVAQLAQPDVQVAANGDTGCASRAGYVVGHMPPVVLCPTFFSDTPEQRIRTMIHEAAHLAGLGDAATGEAYCTVFDCESACGGFDSADAWAHYIHCLSGEAADLPEGIKGESPEDAETRAAKAREPASSARRVRLAGIADRVHEAMEGLGTDEEGVYRALQELDRDDALIRELMAVYAERHRPHTLLDDLNDDFSGTELEFAMQLLNMGRNDTAQHIEEALFTDPKEGARRIREAVEGGGTDEEAIFAALLPFRRDTLQLQRAYQEMYAEDLRDRIEDELEDANELAYAFDLMETPFEHYLNEASSWLRRTPAVGFGLPWGGTGWFDERYWTPFYDRDHDETKLVLNSGRLPHQAIDALFHEQGRWRVDCTVFIEVVQLYALRQSLGATRFDARVGGRMELRMHRSSGVQAQLLYKRESPTERFKATGEDAPSTVGSVEEVLAEVPIGSRVRWTTQLLFDRANNLTGQDVWLAGNGQLTWLPYIHENAMKLAPDRFAAQGVGGGGRVSREKIEDTLADVTADVFPDKPEAEIRAGIYISEIEVFERPDTSAQIDPGAHDGEKGPRP